MVECAWQFVGWAAPEQHCSPGARSLYGEHGPLDSLVRNATVLAAAQPPAVFGIHDFCRACPCYRPSMWLYLHVILKYAETIHPLLKCVFLLCRVASIVLLAMHLPWLLNCGGVGGFVVGGGPTWMLIAAGPEMRCFCFAWMPWPISSNME